MQALTHLLAAILLGIAHYALAAPSSFHAEYDISKGPVRIGVMSRRLAIDADRNYRFESRMETTGIVSLFADRTVVESSAGRLEDGRFRPEHYRYDRGGGKRDFELHFDYAANRVSQVAAGANGWNAPMPPMLLDKLVYQAQLMVDLATGPQRVDYAIADRGKLKQYLIDNLGRETVKTMAGQFETVKLVRDKPGSARRTTVWCAAELGWLPVKVEHRDKKGGVTIAVLRQLRRD